MFTMKQENWKGRTLLFLISQSITLFGSTMVQMAIVWYVTLNTSSGIWVAAFSVCSYLPEFLISFLGGVWADRYHRKKLIIGADFMIALVTLAMILLIPYISGRKFFLWALLMMSVLRSMGAGIQTPAVNAVIPQFVPGEQLLRFNGINAAIQSGVRFAAPAAAGVLLTVNTLRGVLLVDILTAILGIGMLSVVRIPFQKEANIKTSVAADLRAGISYAFFDKLIGRILMVYGLFVFLCVPSGFLAGLLVRRVYGDSYGYLTLVELIGFAGMAAGGILISIWGSFINRKTMLQRGLIVFGVMSFFMGVTTNFICYLVLMAVYGIALTVVQTTITTFLQDETGDSMQGRVFGLLSSVYSGFMPAGMAIFGPLADMIPLQWIMMSSGIMLIIIAYLFHR